MARQNNDFITPISTTVSVWVRVRLGLGLKFPLAQCFVIMKKSCEISLQRRENVAVKRTSQVDTRLRLRTMSLVRQNEQWGTVSVDESNVGDA